MAGGVRRPLTVGAAVLALGWASLGLACPAAADPSETLTCGDLVANWTPSSAGLIPVTCDRDGSPLRLSVSEAGVTVSGGAPATPAATVLTIETSSHEVTLDHLSISSANTPLTVSGGGAVTITLVGDSYVTSTAGAALMTTDQSSVVITTGEGSPGLLSLTAGPLFPALDSSSDVTVIGNDAANPVTVITQGAASTPSPLRATTDVTGGRAVWWSQPGRLLAQYSAQTWNAPDDADYLEVEVPVLPHSITVDTAGGTWPEQIPQPTEIMKYGDDVIIDQIPTLTGAVFAGWTSSLETEGAPSPSVTIPHGASQDVLVTAHWYTAPAPVTNLRAVLSSGAIVVSWTKPTADGGCPISAYLISYSSDGRTWTQIARSGADASANITGLRNGTSYTVRIAAQNEAGLVSGTTQISVTPGAVPSASPTPTATATGGSAGDTAGNAAGEDSLSDMEQSGAQSRAPETQTLGSNRASLVTTLTLAILGISALSLVFRNERTQ